MSVDLAQCPWGHNTRADDTALIGFWVSFLDRDTVACSQGLLRVPQLPGAIRGRAEGAAHPYPLVYPVSHCSFLYLVAQALSACVGKREAANAPRAAQGVGGVGRRKCSRPPASRWD